MPRSTTKILERLVHDEDYLTHWLLAGYTKEYRHLIRHRLDKKQITAKLMEEILVKLGCQQVRPAAEATWKLPDSWY